MSETYTTRLALVRAAIDAILGGAQEVQHEGRRVTYADLDVLQRLEVRYEAQAARETRGTVGGVAISRGSGA